MRLTQILTLEALRNFVNNWDENEIKQNIQNHIAPVTFLRTGSSNTQQNNNKHTNDNSCISDGVIEPNLTSVASHHNCTKIKSVLETLKCDFVFWKIRGIEAMSWVRSLVLWNDI